MKKSVVPFVSVVAFALIASNSVHAAGVNQDELALAALTKLPVQHSAEFATTSAPIRVVNTLELNDHVIGKKQIKVITTRNVNDSMVIAKSNILAINDTIQEQRFDNLFNTLGVDAIENSTATAMLTD